MLDLAGDLANMFRGLPGAVQVSFQTSTTWGLFDAETDLQDLGGQLQAAGMSQALTIATGSLPGVKKGSVLAVGPQGSQVSYKVRFPSLKDDGAITLLWLEVP
ncbi:hypothetical protein [Geothrix sp. 21YS21S-2]|uniref:head-tail joining protein n=1 Tax=Geothrix sp. 21YS21S-2 TaxID=3068893 RepID=UPI0027B89F9B|nr:hypothetical protein [Geothrix sp. 21YS21S-2]